MEHFFHVFGGGCGEHMVWPWLLGGGALVLTALTRRARAAARRAIRALGAALHWLEHHSEPGMEVAAVAIMWALLILGALLCSLFVERPALTLTGLALVTICVKAYREYER